MNGRSFKSLNHKSVLLFTFLLSICSTLSQAIVYMPEAAVSEGPYRNKTHYSISYSGACAEKVGISVRFTSKQSVANNIGKIYKYAEDSVKHIQQRCPKVEIIYADLAASHRKLSEHYLFELHKSSNWRATHKETVKDKFDGMIKELKNPFSTTVDQRNAPGFIGILSSQLRAVYGRTLINQFKSLEIVKKTYDVKGEPHFSHYYLQGKWFELGSELKGKHCENSSEGYAYWGSFSARIHKGQQATFVKKSCVSLSEKGAVDNTSLAAFMGRSEYSSYDRVNPKKDFISLVKEIDALNIQSSNVIDEQFVKNRKPIYQNKHIKIYPTSEDWCPSPELDAVYDVGNEERDKYFDGNYISFVGNAGRKLVSEYCGEPRHVKVNNFGPGDKSAWDTMNFLLKPFKPTRYTNTANYLSLESHEMSDGALADEKLKVWGRVCSGPFCDLHGGLYLNAIYNEDIELIKKLDKTVNVKLQESVKQQSDKILGEGGAQLLKQTFENLSNLRKSGSSSNNKGTKSNQFAPAQVSLLYNIADYYMYNPRGFNPLSMSCNEKLVKKVKTYTNPTYDTFNYNGIYDGQAGGEVYSMTYNVKPAFSGLCDRVCSHLGGAKNPATNILRSSNKSVAFTLDSTVELRSKPKYCKEAQLKQNIEQFERNLISLTNKFLGNRTTWLNGVESSSVKARDYKSATIAPQAKAKLPVPVTANKNNLPQLNELPKLDKSTTHNRPKPQSNKPVENKPAKNIIQEKKPELLASEDKLFINEFQFPKEVTLDNTTLDFLVVTLLSEQLDKNTWVSMLASRWNYEKSQQSPTGGRFFSPSAKQFSASDIDRVMAPFKAWMRKQSGTLPQNLTIPASVAVAKIGPAIHAVPADGCAILGEQKYLLQHSLKLSTAISQSTMPGMQACQQQMKSNLGDILGCMQDHPGDPNFCRQQVQNKLKLCLADSSKNNPDNWDKVSVEWIESNFNTSKCSGHAAYDRLRSLNQMPLGAGSVQVSPARIHARFIFNNVLKLPQVRSGIFDLKNPTEKGVLWFNLKPVSATIAPEISNKGLGIQIHVEVIGTEYQRLQ